MFIKKRKKSTSHIILESLFHRKTLSFEDQKRYENQQRGFEGEQQFDHFINHSEQEGFVVNDLFLSSQETHYQYDSVLVLNGQVTIYEVKNYTGAYRYENGALLSKNGYRMQDPVGQVERKISYLHNWLLSHGYRYSIQSYVVFIGSDFYIYNLPPTDSILFAGQLERHFKELPKQKYAPKAEDKELAEKLVRHHNENYRPDNLPSYGFGDLRKGVLCARCFSFECANTRQTRTCSACGHKEKIVDAIYRSVLEFQVLFPEKPVNIQTIFEWCGGVYAKARIRRLLNRKMNVHRNGPISYYTPN